jgi:hypothetical protein
LEIGLTKIGYLRESIKFCRIKGEAKEDKSRPLKVGLRYFKEKEMILHHARKLNKLEGSWRKIQIVPDLTKTQGDQDLQLRRDVWRTNQNPHRRWKTTKASEKLWDQKDKGGYFELH